MSNATLALNIFTSVLQAVTTAKPGELSAGMSPAGSTDLIQACWQQLTKTATHPGVDAMTSARINALNFANAAMFGASQAPSQKQIDSLQSAAAAYLKIHDSLAGVTWYTTPGTVRALRSESRQIQDNAALRGLLAQIVESLATLARNSTRH